MSAFDIMPDGFVFAVCENCQVEGQFPASLVCPDCGKKAMRYVAISAAELDDLPRRVAELEAGISKISRKAARLAKDPEVDGISAFVKIWEMVDALKGGGE